MDTSSHDLGSLFAQLGLGNSQAEIEAFLATHRLAPGAALTDAPFWSQAQAQFLNESLMNDSVWAVVADELAMLLSRQH